MRLFLTIVISSLLLTSCLPEKEQEIKITQKYTLKLPSYLEKVDDLNDEASLEYQNLFRAFYVIVIDEPIEEFGNAIAENGFDESYDNSIESYSTVAMSGIESNLKLKRKTKAKDMSINGLPAKLITVNATIEDVDVFYNIAFIKGKKNYYQIMTWTLEEYENDYKEKMNKIFKSFKEI